MLFGYSGDNGTQCLGWYNGTVPEVVNEKTNRVRIEWGTECLGEYDMRVMYQKFVLSN